MSNKMIERLLIVFGAPARENVDGYLKEIAELTDHFGETVLDRAATALVRDGGHSWPAPKAIVQACVDARETLSGKTITPRAETEWGKDDERATRWARAFCQRTDLGRRAFDEGWGRQVYNWARALAAEHLRKQPYDAPHRGFPAMEWRPDAKDIEYWVRYCRAPASMIDFERSVCLGEPLAPEEDARLAAKIAKLRAGGGINFGLKRMPMEDDAA